MKDLSETVLDRDRDDVIALFGQGRLVENALAPSVKAGPVKLGGGKVTRRLTIV